MSDLAYEHNGRRVDRADFYAIACDPRRSVAVEACAGAGKTWMLVSRILRALLDGCAPHEILAITFTKKAAGEMRERLHEWMAEFAGHAPERLRQELEARGLPAQALADGTLARRLQGLQQSVLTAGRPVQIRTFHGWFASLLRAAPLALLERLGLPAQYQLLEDDSQAVARVWRPFFAMVQYDDALRADFHAAVALHGRSQTLKALEAALGRRVEFALADADGVVETSVEPWPSAWPGADPSAETPAAALLLHAPRLYAASAALGAASAKTFVAKGVELEQAVTAGDAAGVCAALLTQKGEPRKFSEKLVGLHSVQAAQELVMAYVAAQAQHEAREHQQRMVRLARVLLAEYAGVKRERGWIDMNDVEQAAQLLLSDPVMSGWVQQRLDAQVRHLLVDEFQDTNPLQWQALQAWLSGYAGAGGGGLGVFLVGDPKQSIYRFRRAEPQVFRAAQRFVVEGLGGDRLACDHTRRNAPAVISAVNAAMDTAQSAGEYAGFRDHTTESSQAGAVRRLPAVPREDGTDDRQDRPAWRDSLTTPRVLPEETLRHRECRQAASWLATQIADGISPREVMVLSRRRAALSAMEDALRDVQVPAQQPEKADLCDAPEVQDIVALLDALVSPGHDVSLARALRSPLFGLEDADLVQIALARQRLADAGAGEQHWLAVLQAESAGLAPHIAAVAPVLLRWQRWVNRLPPHDAIDAIFHDGDVLARYAAAVPVAMRDTMIARLRALPGTALALDGGRFATPYAFVRALKAGGVPAPVRTEPDAVRLLTVHGAKGLEADLVLMLDTDGQATRSETMGVLVDWPGEASAPRSFVFLASESAPPPSVAAAVAAERAERQREEINGLYVAMTRARRQLVLSSCEPHRANPLSWWRRLHDLCEPIELETWEAMDDVAAGAVTARASVAIADYPLPALPLLPAGVPIDWPLPPDLADDAAPEPVEQRRLDADIGLAMHRLLEWSPADDAGYGEVQQAAVAREFGLNDEQAQQASRLAFRVRGGEGRWAWDEAQVDWQGNEVPLVFEGDTLRIDRLVRKRESGEWWVLDFKSAVRPERQPALRAQLAGYRAAVRAASPGQPVFAAFLTGQGTLVVLGDDDDRPSPQNMPPADAPVSAASPAKGDGWQTELF
ncbi:UvrD-helicase domain-containing protein [Xylophilus sp. GOD-11R]|uniref:UvrD-helicase domain-containing protein n=1 Tax=Xylophilus sp. GOD-11R TaxID=3089814 RepID=UPI00298C40CF|nr:UvrD-helicase domain-containing protein [Xylophilus sp. GOD-11R]WPB58720.1 UvrD-helicase domain-containing protein [Xylophilus sp. GOD-11R]